MSKVLNVFCKKDKIGLQIFNALKNKMRFKQVQKSDLATQKELLLVALWTPDNEPNHLPETLELPHIKEYFDGWGRKGDLGLLALNCFNEPMGLVQVRFKSSQTELYSDYPELALAVYPQFQGRGVASCLLSQVVDVLKGTCSGIRLGVHPQNTAAIALYEKFSFKTYDVAQSGYPQMVREY